MTRAKELRIGNTIKTDNEDFYNVTIEDLQFLLDDPLDDYYQEIQLTRKLLLKYFNSTDPVLFTNSDGDSFYLSDTKIKYLHELQNLYFALTGEELKVI